MSDTKTEQVGPALAALQQKMLDLQDDVKAVEPSPAPKDEPGHVWWKATLIAYRRCADALTPLIARATELEQELSSIQRDQDFARRWRGKIADQLHVPLPQAEGKVWAAIEAALAASEAELNVQKTANDCDRVQYQQRLDGQALAQQRHYEAQREAEAKLAASEARVQALEAELAAEGFAEGFRKQALQDSIDGCAQRVKQLADNLKASEAARQQAEQERDRLRTALVGLVGATERAELEELEAVMRVMPAPAEDKAKTIDAIHALIATVRG